MVVERNNLIGFSWNPQLTVQFVTICTKDDCFHLIVIVEHHPNVATRQEIIIKLVTAEIVYKLHMSVV